MCRFSASLDLHRSIMSLVSSDSPSENSLVLTYSIPPREVIITLVFIPNTRQLASAQVDGVDEMDVAEVVDSHVLRNDVSGLVAAVLTSLNFFFFQYRCNAFTRDKEIAAW